MHYIEIIIAGSWGTETMFDTCVIGHDDAHEIVSSMDECWQLCTLREDFNCQTVEFVPISGLCVLSKDAVGTLDPSEILSPSSPCSNYLHVKSVIYVPSSK